MTGTQISDMTISATMPAGAFVPFVASNADPGFSLTQNYIYDLGADLLTRVSYNALAASDGASFVGTTDGDVQSDLDGRPTSAILESSAGGSMVGFERSGGVLGTVSGVLLETWRVTDFMTEAEIADVTSGAGALDVTAAIQAAVDAMIAAGAGRLVFAKGLYKITDTITVERGTDNIGVIFEGSGRDTIIRQTGAGKDAIKWTQTRFLFNSGIRDIKITCDATAGHCINIGYGISTNFFHNVELVQSNTGKSLFYGDFSSGGGIYDTSFRSGSWYCAVGASVAGFRVICGGTFFNENVFENLRCYYASGEQFFKITAESGSSYWLVNNRWQNINFEVSVGGGFYLACMRICGLKNISFWDAGGNYTGNLVEFASGTGYESTANCLENVGRHGGSLAVGVQDIKITAGQDTVITNCYTQTSDAPFYDFGGKRVTVVGRFVGTITNDSQTRMFSTGSGAIKFPGCTTYLNYYDEGTWTATIGGSGANPTTPVTATGSWTRTGRQVFVTVEFTNVDTTGASGNVVVTGLPFTANATYKAGTAIATQGLGSAAIVLASGTTLSLYQQAARASTVTHAAGSGPGTGKYITIAASYIV